MNKSRTHYFFGTELLKRLTIYLKTAGLIGLLGITLGNPESLAQVSTGTTTTINVPSIAVTPIMFRSCPEGSSQLTEQQEAADEAANTGCYSEVVDDLVNKLNQVCNMNCENWSVAGGNKDACYAMCFTSDRYTCRRTSPRSPHDRELLGTLSSCGRFAHLISDFYPDSCCGFYRAPE